ncbi:MAG: hypothetical protein KAS72_06745 [Phycisphaerales bacterium]|nr:hypothetical protein [Phycisphaerales bacterium]
MNPGYQPSEFDACYEFLIKHVGFYLFPELGSFSTLEEQIAAGSVAGLPTSYRVLLVTMIVIGFPIAVVFGYVGLGLLIGFHHSSPFLSWAGNLGSVSKALAGMGLLLAAILAIAISLNLPWFLYRHEHRRRLRLVAKRECPICGGHLVSEITDGCYRFRCTGCGR